MIDKPKGARDGGVKMGCVPSDQGVSVAGRRGVRGFRPDKGVSYCRVHTRVARGQSCEKWRRVSAGGAEAG